MSVEYFQSEQEDKQNNQLEQERFKNGKKGALPLAECFKPGFKVIHKIKSFIFKWSR